METPNEKNTVIEVGVDDLSDGRVIDLLRLHREEMFLHSPPESIHALDVESLSSPEMTFVSAKLNDQFCGCGGLKRLSVDHAEIKSMKTVRAMEGRGVGSAVLQFLLDFAKAEKIKRVSLETGTEPAFDSARRLYERYGFTGCPPFDGYQPDDNSCFYTLRLDG